MHTQLPLYQQIYHKIVRDILNGTYRCGDRLPSKAALCRQYGVGEASIRMSVKLLREAGFIRTERRHTATVVFDTSAPATYERLQGIYAERLKILSDRLMAFNLLIAPAFARGASLMTRQEIRDCCALASGLSSAPAAQARLREQTLALTDSLLAKVGNQLLIYFSSDVSPFTSLPYDGLVSRPHRALCEEVCAYVRQLAALMDAGQFPQIAQLTLSLDPILHQEGEVFLEYLSPEAFLPEHPGYSSEGYLYTQVVDRVIRGVIAGAYPEGGLLPTEVQMGEQCGVSRITVRAAYKVLGDIGITDTVQGSGTRILHKAQRIHRNYRVDATTVAHIKSYFTALETILIPARRLARYAAERCEPDDARTLLHRLNAQGTFLSARNIYPAMLLIELIARRTDNAVIQAFSTYLTDMLYWGFYFESMVDDRYLEQQREGRVLCLRAVHALQDRNAEEFSRLVAEFFVSLGNLSRDCCRSISPALSAIAPAEFSAV